MTTTVSKFRTPMTFLAGAMLALATGCVGDEADTTEEPEADETRAVDLASKDGVALGITSWHYAPHETGLVVRGLDASSAPVASFWIEPNGDSEHELVAHDSDGSGDVTIPRDGALTGDDDLRSFVTAFRSDIEASQRDKSGTQDVNDNVMMCPGSVGTFGTWAFWATTTISIDNPYQDKWLKFSFQAGLGYEEQWVPPAPYSSVPWFFYWRNYPRQYWGVPVTVRYLDSWPDGAWGPCRRVRVY